MPRNAQQTYEFLAGLSSAAAEDMREAPEAGGMLGDASAWLTAQDLDLEGFEAFTEPVMLAYTMLALQVGSVAAAQATFAAGFQLGWKGHQAEVMKSST